MTDPFIAYCEQDAEPDILARSFAVGFSLGLCPVVGEHPQVDRFAIALATAPSFSASQGHREQVHESSISERILDMHPLLTVEGSCLLAASCFKVSAGKAFHLIRGNLGSCPNSSPPTFLSLPVPKRLSLATMR